MHDLENFEKNLILKVDPEIQAHIIWNQIRPDGPTTPIWEFFSNIYLYLLCRYNFINHPEIFQKNP